MINYEYEESKTFNSMIHSVRIFDCAAYNTWFADQLHVHVHAH